MLHKGEFVVNTHSLQDDDLNLTYIYAVTNLGRVFKYSIVNNHWITQGSM
jgi:hypothetical protein